MASTSSPTIRADDRLIARLSKALVDGSLPGEIEGFGPAARRDAAAFALSALETRKGGRGTIAIDTFADAKGRRRMRIAVVNPDMPFLVDSVAAVITSHGLVIERLLHPVVSVSRNATGTLTGLAKGDASESLIYLETDRADAKVRVAIREELERSLADVRDAVADWPRLRDAMRADADALGDSENAALLSWFADNHFTLLGHFATDASGAPLGLAKRDTDAPLGLAKREADTLLSPAARASALAWFGKGGEVLIVKSNRISTVHRRVPLDLVIAPIRSGKTVSGLSIHAGLWTSAALSEAPETVPVLRTRLAALQKKFDFASSSHSGKSLAHAIASLPHDIAISVSESALEPLTLAAMSIADRPRPAVELLTAPLDRHLFAFVWLPRDELTTARRIAIADMIGGPANAPLLSWSIDLGDGDTALIRYTFDLRQSGRLPDAAQIDAQLQAMVRGWPEAVEVSLAAMGDAGNATRLALRYADAFPPAYRSGAGPEEAARDVFRLNALADAGSRQVRFYRNAEDGPETIRLKIYSLVPLILSDAVPSLENFGFRAVEELSTTLSGGLGHVQRFVLLTPGVDAALVMKSCDTLEMALAQVLEGTAENDEFNQLILALGLSPFDVTLFRALFRYLRQIGISYGLLTVVAALRNAPEIARALAKLFAQRFDPAAKGLADHDAAITRLLGQVAAIDDDRILRLLRSVIRATLRTNAFAPAAREALAFKIESAGVHGLPAPVPWREIFVYSPRVEGIHLRAGPVARGGLRWSDRRDDFRTEILGLMKAQRVKNAVIVPTGAKGGFYPKMLPDPANREAWLAEGTESYRIFIRSLLSITDNLADGKVIKPEGVVCHDGDDPYFVVAADKGTATFSDVANAIALERGFWLGDAFASGGSVGYDHKAMGITAKGAWVSVQRHFAEMGTDVQKTPIKVAGCGDMSGDVFGNGMLLSKAIKLVAAFDHRHIFIDPEPDPAASWKERARMFKLPRSSWADYDAKLISKGGGIFPRSAKSINLSKQARAAVGIDVAEIEPAALISAILKCPVDLMWFGGIGTYVKARAESHAQAGDRANDALRVDAEDLRCKAIGEGANLGVTQAARIAFSLQGGRINTDFIDNSAGVDCSDNEVNIKIALNAQVAASALTMPKRNVLLASMTDDVGAIVLEDNRLQTLALSIAERGGARALPSQIRLIETFESEKRLDRAVEGLASNDALRRRAQDGFGLTRPELAVILATAKLTLQDAIETSEFGNDPATIGDLIAAFPAPMRKGHMAAIEGHRLRREIVATKLANRIVNRMGLIHPFELAEEEGCTLVDVAEAFVIAEQVYDIASLWTAIDNEPMPEAARLMLFEQVAVEMRAHMADILRNAVAGRRNDQAITAYHPVISLLSNAIEALLPPEAQRQTQAYADRLAKAGAPRKIVERLVQLARLDGAIGIAALATRMQLEPVAVTRAFTALGEALGVDWAQGAAMQLDPHDPWERLLAAGLARDFQAMRLDFLSRHGGSDPQAGVAAWIEAQAARVVAFRAMIDRARLAMPTTAMLAQIAGQARVLLGR